MDLYKIFGYAGALPFLGLSFGLLVVPEPEMQSNLAMLQLCYAGMIASFLGGVHWAHGLKKEGARDHHAQIFAAMQPTVISLLLVVVALVTQNFGVIFILATLAFIGLFVLDQKLLEESWLPDDYFAFRRRITTIVSVAFMISAVAFWL